MCDKFGYVWRAPANASGGFDLDQQPVAHLGSGRPLGFHFDAEGGLVVAMAGAVRPTLCLLFIGLEADAESSIAAAERWACRHAGCPRKTYVLLRLCNALSSAKQVHASSCM